MVATSWFFVIFRLIHIVAGVLWVGGVFLFVVFVQPSAAAIAPAGAPFLAELLGKRRLVDRLIGFGVLTVIGGLFLYWHYVELFGLADFVSNTFGAWITVGGVAAIAALAVGVFGTRPRVMQLLAIGRQAAEAGGPTPGQGAAMGALQGQMKTLARVSLALIAVAVFAMSTARAWAI